MIYDVAIIGAGPAGLTAAIYASRSRLKTVLFEKISPGGQIALTHCIENYPGIESMNGYELGMIMEKQARNFGAELMLSEITGLKKTSDGLFQLNTSKEIFQSKSVIAATGAPPRRLGVEGEKESLSMGVSYCAVCDGAFFKGKAVAVVGGGNTAIEEAVYLTKFASRVYVIHRRDELRAVKIIQEKAFANEKIEFVWSSIVTRICGEQKVTGLDLKNKKTGETSFLPLDGVFIYVGMEPASGIYDDFADRDEWGFLVTDKNMLTKTPGFFAAGDIRDKTIWQVSVAVGDGTMAALNAEKYLAHLL